MKKIAAMAAIVALVSMPALAVEQGGFSGPGAAQTSQTSPQKEGFIGPSGSVTTAEKVASLSDNSWVTLRGKIVERLSDDRYKFQDASGTVNVEIGRKRWNGLTVTPQDTVELQGKVDKDWNSLKVDVKQIHKITP